MRTVYIPDALAERVEAKGLPLDRFVVDALEEKLADESKSPHKTIKELLASGWTLPTIEGNPRADGRPWSEIEAPCD